MAPTLETALRRIAAGEDVPAAELLPFLVLERREERAEVNARLAQAYLEGGGNAGLERARTFVRRAWLLSRFSTDLLPLYTRIHEAAGDVSGIQEAYKRLGMLAASQGQVTEALEYFDLWQRAFPDHAGIGRYDYDLDVLEAVDRLAAPLRPPVAAPRLPRDRKIRVAYLVKGIVEDGSVLVRINVLFARHHDRSRFDVRFFVPEPDRAVRESAAAREHCAWLSEAGAELVTAPDLDPAERRLRATASAIRDWEADLLVTTAAIAEFGHYFVTTLRPAPLVVSLVQGPAAQFAPLTADWTIAWSRPFALESPAGVSLIPMELDPPGPDVAPVDRHELGIPEEAPLLASAGRVVKLRDHDFWRAVGDILAAHPGAHYLVIGASEEQLPFVRDLLPRGVAERVRFGGWLAARYVPMLAAADIVLDTYPAGGGATITDAMALGIPVVTFRNDYFKAHDESDWSAAEEVMDFPELTVPRGDFDEMKRITGELIEDVALRRDLGVRCRDQVLATRSDPARTVRRCEEVYLRLLRGEAGGGPLAAEGGASRVRPYAAAAAALRAAASGIDRLTWLINGGARALRLTARKLERE